MSISDTQKIDLIWKKLLFNISDTQVNVKQATEEIIPSLLPLYGDAVWSDSKSILIPAPTLSTTTVSVHTVQCISDPTVPGNRTWIPVNNINNSPLNKTNRIQDWIPPTFDPSYLIKVYAGNPNDVGNPAIPLNAIDNNNEWIFDYISGVLTFLNNVPSSVSNRGIWIKGFQYIGEFGVTKPSDLIGFLRHISEDISPKLGGTLDLDGHNIITNGNIILTPGQHLQLEQNIWPKNDGTYNQVLSTTGSGYLYWTTINVDYTLQIPISGSYDQPINNITPAITSWVPHQTTYSDALDNLNRLFGKLVPGGPPPLSSKTLTISGGNSNYKVSNNLPLNGLSSPTTTLRFTSSSISTDIVSTFGNGDTGTLTVLINNTPSGSKLLDNNNATGTYNSLQITSDTDFPLTQPGFHKALSAKINGNALPGLNDFKMIHSETGSIEIQFIYDNINIVPIATTPILTEITPGSFTYSSSIPNYNNNATLGVVSTISNLSTMMYVPNNIVQISSSTNDIINLNPGDCGIPSILNNPQNPITLTNATYKFNNTSHIQTKIGVRGSNPSNIGQYVYCNTLINVMNGTPTGGIYGPMMEMNVPVINVGAKPNNANDNAGRIIMSDGDTPIDDMSSLLTPNWNSSSVLTDYDAVVIGGILKYDLTDYSTYLPVGPNLSTRTATRQYITFMFRRYAASQFKIRVRGTYSGCWVKLPNLSNIPHSLNGWWDMFSAYSNAGVPGRDNNGPGCALASPMTGTDIDAVCTFGTETSSNSTNNLILVRFKLFSGQKITGLSFEGA